MTPDDDEFWAEYINRMGVDPFSQPPLVAEIEVPSTEPGEDQLIHDWIFAEKLWLIDTPEQKWLDAETAWKVETGQAEVLRPA